MVRTGLARRALLQTGSDDARRTLCPRRPCPPAQDEVSKHKFLISGQGSLIFNPPSAWAAAVRDAPKVAERICHLAPLPPKVPQGCGGGAVSWSTWKFSSNKSAAESLLTFLWRRSSIEQTVAASHGYDIPPFEGLHDFKTWAEEPPPGGSICN